MRFASHLTTAIFLLVALPATSLRPLADWRQESGGNDWLHGITTDGDVECKVEHSCIVGSGLGTCVVMVDPATAKPMGSTDKGYATDFNDNNIVEKNRVARFSAPASNITVSGHSHSAHWNLCWGADAIDRRNLRSAGVEDFCYWVNGLCFLWASPCSGGCSQLNSLSTYSSFCPVLRYASEAEWSAAVPTLTADNEAFYSKCAASQLDPRWKHCDKGNTLARVEDNGYSDLVLVCESATPPGARLSGSAASPAAAHALETLTTEVPVAATGDPHLQNIHGERFDLMRPGKHVLIHIPRGERVENALLRVEAEARRLGGHCADMYFQELNITGAWLDSATKQTSGLHFEAQAVRDEHPKWMKFGKVELKVAHGRTHHGTLYLNVYVKHLGRTGLAVGGLLGEDDHKEAAMPTESCAHHVSLLEDHEGGSSRISSFFRRMFRSRTPEDHGASGVSVAEASLA